MEMQLKSDFRFPKMTNQLQLKKSACSLTKTDFLASYSMISSRLRAFLLTLSFSLLLGLTGHAETSALTWTQLSPATSPPARSYLAMTFDEASNKVLVFGGFSGSGYLNDTWTFDGSTWTKINTAVSPPARAASQKFCTAQTVL